MKYLAFFIWFGVIVTAQSTQAQMLQEWLRTYNSPADSSDAATCATITSSGEVCVAGWTQTYTSSSDFLTITYSAQGDLLWLQTYDGTAGTGDIVQAIAVDSQDNIYITGQSYGVGSGADIVTIKYSASGQQEWVERWDGSASDNDYPIALKVDDQGNVYVTGSSTMSQSGQDLILLKYSTFGGLMWVSTYQGSENFMDYGADLVIDSVHNVFVVGSTATVPYGWYCWDVVTIKFNSAGETLWTRRYSNSDPDTNDVGVAIGLSGLGQVLIAAEIGDNNYPPQRSILIEYSSNGDFMWEQTVPCRDTKYLATTDGGEIYVAGLDNINIANYNYCLVKFNLDGLMIWKRIYVPYGFPGGQELSGLALDNFGNVYISGNYWSGFLDDNLVTIKYNSEGILQWVQWFSGPGWGATWGGGLVLDDSGHVFAAGAAWYSGNDMDAVTVKYDQDHVRTTVNLAPLTYPIEIPASGGSFDFILSVTNYTAGLQTVDLWGEVICPDNIIVRQVLSPYTVVVDSTGVGWFRTQWVPAEAPSGVYSFAVYIGDSPWEVWDSDYFTFVKLSEGFGVPVSQWVNSGNSWNEANTSKLNPVACRLMNLAPNPFNSTTSISFEVSTMSLVSLKVYAINGQLVAVLCDGWQNIGRHEVQFDGSNLPSALYIYRFSAGNYSTSGKMLLLK
jgi:hypothetical protein